MCEPFRFPSLCDYRKMEVKKKRTTNNQKKKKTDPYPSNRKKKKKRKSQLRTTDHQSRLLTPECKNKKANKTLKHFFAQGFSFAWPHSRALRSHLLPFKAVQLVRLALRTPRAEKDAPTARCATRQDHGRTGRRSASPNWPP